MAASQPLSWGDDEVEKSIIPGGEVDARAGSGVASGAAVVARWAKRGWRLRSREVKLGG